VDVFEEARIYAVGVYESGGERRGTNYVRVVEYGMECVPPSSFPAVYTTWNIHPLRWYLYHTANHHLIRAELQTYDQSGMTIQSPSTLRKVSQSKVKPTHDQILGPNQITRRQLQRFTFLTNQQDHRPPCQ
jgi:hypothetical protein